MAAAGGGVERINPNYVGFEGGVFFDNAPKHIKELDNLGIKTLTTIAIPQTGDHIGDMSMYGGTALSIMIATLKSNLYLQALMTLGITSDSYDPVSGIEGSHLAAMFTAFGKVSGGYSTRFALFDWDRTLTKFEGVYPESKIIEALGKRGLPTPDPASYREDMLIYLFGGNIPQSFDGKRFTSRLNVIRHYLNLLFSIGIHVYILTNNGGCGTEDFTKMVAALHPGISAGNIICSRPLGGDKGAAVAMAGLFKHVPSSGGRRSRRRRNQARRARSRRQNRRL